MNEQRQQAYLNLINQLLSCNEGNEPRILQENQELLDQGLIEAMIAVAQQFEELGREYEAQWLINIKQQLLSSINYREVSFKEYDEFIQKLLQAELESNSNPNIVYPILRQYQYLLDEKFIQLLQDFFKDFLSNKSLKKDTTEIDIIGNLCIKILQFPWGNRAKNIEIAIVGYKGILQVYKFEAYPQKWATVQHNLGNAYLDRIRGDKAENIETAIAAYTNALKVRTWDASPQQWAMIQNNLGNAYLNRIRGDKAENIETAIAAYTNALKVRTWDASPQQWAMTQTNLGNAYFSRIKGNKAKNLEMAIAAYTNALKVSTLDIYPYEWALIQNNLGNVYSDRIRGDKAENLEMAIVAFSEALKVRTQEDFPYEWAMTKQNLASAYFSRIKGNKAENLEMAISAYTETLKVYTLDAFPYEWAVIQNHLGNAYSERIRGDKAKNLEFAIKAFSEALKVFTCKAFPQDWAMTKHNLATTYSDRIKGDKAENLEMAVVAFSEALKVRTQEDFPQDWAMTKHSLASTYSDRIKGNKAENLEMAVVAFSEALKVRTQEDFPYEWAETHVNLGNTFLNRIKGDKAENLEKAIQAYQNALKIYTQKGDLINCLGTARNLANLYYREKKWQQATEAYYIAIKTVENIRLEALNPQSRQEVLSNAIDIFHHIVQVHLKLNQPYKALEYVERSKARNLVELMTNKNIEPQGVDIETLNKLNELRQRAVNEQINLQNQVNKYNIRNKDNLTPYTSDYSHLKEYQKELDEFIEQEITPIDPTFKLTQKVETISFDEIQALVNPKTCLVEWYITNERILAFIITSDSLKVWQSTSEELQKLLDWKDEYLEAYQQNKTQWINTLDSYLNQLSTILHLDEVLDLIPQTCNQLRLF